MTVRWMMIGAIAWSAAAMAVAEPAQPTGRTSDQQSNRGAPVVLASAERIPEADARGEEAQEPATPAKRPRAARVTTCRCGDPSEN